MYEMPTIRPTDAKRVWGPILITNWLLRQQLNGFTLDLCSLKSYQL
jgi:hypothetical protein